LGQSVAYRHLLDECCTAGRIRPGGTTRQVGRGGRSATADRDRGTGAAVLVDQQSGEDERADGEEDPGPPTWFATKPEGERVGGGDGVTAGTHLGQRFLVVWAKWPVALIRFA
jgi:hypothetical protein